MGLSGPGLLHHPWPEDIILADEDCHLNLSWLRAPEGEKFTTGNVAEHQKGGQHRTRRQSRAWKATARHSLGAAPKPQLQLDVRSPVWSQDGHAAAILAQLMHADPVKRRSVFTTGMPGTGKTRSLAIACVMTAIVAQRKVIYATISNEPVRSVTACLDELLASSHGTVRAAFRRIPADEEAKKSITAEAPRHKAAFRVIFGSQNDGLQMGYGAGNIDRPGKFP